jgi:hypothetical protein
MISREEKGHILFWHCKESIFNSLCFYSRDTRGQERHARHVCNRITRSQKSTPCSACSSRIHLRCAQRETSLWTVEERPRRSFWLNFQCLISRSKCNWKIKKNTICTETVTKSRHPGIPSVTQWRIIIKIIEWFSDHISGRLIAFDLTIETCNVLSVAQSTRTDIYICFCL